MITLPQPINNDDELIRYQELYASGPDSRRKCLARRPLLPTLPTTLQQTSKIRDGGFSMTDKVARAEGRGRPTPGR